MSVVPTDQSAVTPGASLDDIDAVYRASFGRLLAVAAALCGGTEDGREAV